MKKKFRCALVCLLVSGICFNSGFVFSQVAETESGFSALEAWNAKKFGMFIHWGDYAALGGIYDGKKIPRLGEQIQRHAEAPNCEYEKTVRDFNPVKFNAEEWVDIALIAGMKYMVLTVKHHNGFCLWDSETTGYDIMEATAFKRDPVKELAMACEKSGLGFGIYYSTVDWHFPGSVKREVPGQFSVFETIPPEHQQYSVAQLKELCSGRYGDLTQVFFDMGLPTPEQSREYRNTVKSLQSRCLINGRIMNNEGDFLTMPDNAVPNAPISQAWEAPSTFYHWTDSEIPGWSNEWWNTWGFKSWIPRPPLDLQVEKQLGKMAMIVSRGGNFLLNVGPDGTGRIIEYEKQVLREIGKWLEINGDAIYGTDPTPFTRDPELICTHKPGKLFFFLAPGSEGRNIQLPGLRSKVTTAYLLSDQEKTSLEVFEGNETTIQAPDRYNNPWMEVAVVEYEGELVIETPVITPNEEHTIDLSLDGAYITGSYDSESYKSLANDTHCNWDVRVDKTGIYRVDVELKTRQVSSGYLLTIGDIEFPLESSGNTMNLPAGEVKLSKSDRIKVSLSPLEKKSINQNGSAQFNRLMLEDVRIMISPLPR